MKRTILTVVCLAITLGTASALKSFQPIFISNYKIKADSNLGKAQCAACHATPKGGKLNAYGKDLKAALAKTGGKVLNAAVLKSVEGLDSSKSGQKNIDKIKADKLPG